MSLARQRVVNARRFPLAAPLLAFQLLLLAGTAPWYSTYGLRVAWWTAWPLVLGYGLLFALGGYVRRYANHPEKAIFQDVVVATALLLVLTNIVAPAQYLAIALHRPLIDAWLARADAVLGIHVPSLALWTSHHSSVALLLTLCYVSLMPQFLLPIVLLALRFRDRERLWEYIFHFHFCLVVTLAALAVFPAECPFLYYGFPSTLDQTRFIAQFTALRNGTFHVLSFADLDGLISIPSFHVAGGLMVAWAFRGYRRMSAILVPLNAGLIAATFMTGAHYAVDAVASVVLFALSVFVYRRHAAWLVRREDAIAEVAGAGAAPARLLRVQ